MRRTTIAAMAVFLAAAACGGVPGVPGGARTDAAHVDASRLTETRGCGYGFAVATPEHDVRLTLYLGLDDLEAADRGAFPRRAELPDPAWTAELVLGERLYANWCDDVVEDPVPVVSDRWAVTGGQLTLQDGPPPRCDGTFEANLEALEVTPPRGAPILLGDVELTTDEWGCSVG